MEGAPALAEGQVVGALSAGAGGLRADRAAAGEAGVELLRVPKKTHRRQAAARFEPTIIGKCGRRVSPV